jgi:hypothetical protein
MKTQNIIMFIIIAIYASCTFGQTESKSINIASANERHEISADYYLLSKGYAR